MIDLSELTSEQLVLLIAKAKQIPYGTRNGFKPFTFNDHAGNQRRPAARNEAAYEGDRLTGLASTKELLNAALSLFEWVTRERQVGRTVASIDKQLDRYRELQMESLDRAAEKR